MALFVIKCPQCGGEKVKLTGKNQYECQYCGTKFTKADEPSEQQSSAPVYRCPYCGGEIVMGARKCRHCGEWFTQSSQHESVSTQSNCHQKDVPGYAMPKSKDKAIFLALVLGFVGAHEFYLGRTKMGFGYLFVTLLSAWETEILFAIGVLLLVQIFSYLTMSDEQFAAKYN